MNGKKHTQQSMSYLLDDISSLFHSRERFLLKHVENCQFNTN
ncbi:hypothetical protein HMPREF3038_01203 [Akkermansia sp. KLE1797]|nr:hypothetical protein HMPREF3038_01203 [Akkermansia sp. KLE1797]KXU52887.1 hypothetical protein HMPREF3039_03053 [Akkermansia sp. KLE1798]